jgi:hypothetical protein
VSAVSLWVALFTSVAFAQDVEIEVEDEDDVEIEVEATPEPVEAAPSAEVVALREQIAALTARLERVEAERAEQPPAPAPDETAEPDESPLRFSGYIQAQYHWSDLSEDELLVGGAIANLDRFAIRRGRLRLEGEWEHFGVEIELDGSTTNGPFFGLRRTTVSTAIRRDDRDAPPYLEVSAGITEIPFGHEVRASQREFPFMERSLGSLSFFPGPLDIGLRVQGALGPFLYDLAAMSGTPLDDRAGGDGLDPTAAPDLAGRLATAPDLPDAFALEGGVSFLWGTGFHRGQDAVKGRLEWRDLNENGTLETGETIAIPGRAATPSETFDRWAVNVDLSAGLKTSIGWTRLYAEATARLEPRSRLLRRRSGRARLRRAGARRVRVGDAGDHRVGARRLPLRLLRSEQRPRRPAARPLDPRGRVDPHLLACGHAPRAPALHRRGLRAPGGVPVRRRARRARARRARRAGRPRERPVHDPRAG